MMASVQEQAVYYIREEMGIVLEEIADYMTNLTKEYKDPNLTLYFKKYVTAAKRLNWTETPIQLNNYERRISVATIPTQT